MAYTTVNKSTLHFNTKLWAGDSASSRTITGVGFQPDLTWIKPRNLAYSHTLVDAVRGASGNGTISGTLISNSNGVPEGNTNSDGTITAFASDGFTLTAGSSSSGRTNGGYNYCSWNWKANGAGSSNSDGDITSTVSANTTSGFSIVTYTGNGSASNIGHGLGIAPKCVIIKKTSASADWLMGHVGLHATLPWKYGINLNNQEDVHESGSYFADTAPTNSVFRVEANDEVNTSGQTYIAYCFADVKGFSKLGRYIGNGNAFGTFVYTGFKPAFILCRYVGSGNGYDFIMYDNKRPTISSVSYDINPIHYILESNTNDAENAGTDFKIDFLSNGFKFRGNESNVNDTDAPYLYMAFADAPLVGTNNVPCTAR